VITVTLACGHVVKLDDGSVAPSCVECGETRVTQVKAPAPRFRGAALGPCAQDKERS
jgi:hypothetical protein